jgi:hypothetical protein
MFPLNFLNKNIIYLRNKKIEEYDIQQGGYSCALKYELLSDEEIVLLSNFNKKERHIYLGNKARKEASTARLAQMGTGDRSERIRTYNFPQSRITDHRVGLTIHQLNEVLAGDMEPIIDPLKAYFQAELLKQQGLK